MAHLLFELGCEELPASFVAKALRDLEEAITRGLNEARLEFGPTETYGTPRRLIVAVNQIQDRQADSIKESRGPSASAAFDSDGNPSKALQGFCRGQGIDPSQVVNDGEYVWAKIPVLGRAASEILAEILPAAVRGLTFEKTMRWGHSRMRFARPIRWMLALLDGQVVPFEIEGVSSGNTSRGHRFAAPEPFEVNSLDALLSELRSRNVEPDSAKRESMLREQAVARASGTPDLPESLVDENVYLTEWPQAHEGSFDEAYLNLPDPVLVTAMAKHQRFFPVRNSDGSLQNKFIAIRNHGEESSVKAGNEWVLNARFNDATFFYREDQNKSMDEFLAATERMLFQEKLGTVRDRSHRLSALARFVVASAGLGTTAEDHAAKAGLYAKADLSTGLVSELSSLQGIIGGEYARREGFAEEVCWAIAAQYDLGKQAGRADLASRIAIALVAADQVDKLAGFLGLGLIPKGSSDPFGLRRAATLLVEASRLWPEGLGDLQAPLAQAFDLYRAEGQTLDEAGAKSALADLLCGRYEALFPAVRHDLMAGALAGRTLAEVAQPNLIVFRTEALALLADDVATLQTLSRPVNILASAEKKGDFSLPGSLDAAGLKSSEGEALAAALPDATQAMQSAVARHDARSAVHALQALAAPIHAFFENTMVMDEDLAVRGQRLQLLSETRQIIRTIGDISAIVIEG